jgi:hypothetical protein
MRMLSSAATLGSTPCDWLINPQARAAAITASTVALPVDELLLAWLAVNALLHESEDRKAATQRLLELLLGRAHAALARLAVLGAEQQQVSVAGWDLVKQRPARVPVARWLGLEHDGIHPKRLDCRPAALANSGHVTTEQ